MYGKIKDHLCTALENLKQAGLYKEERIIESPQQAAIQVKGKEVLNFCANNYLLRNPGHSQRVGGCYL